MTYQEALALVKSEFETRRDAAHCEVILTGRTLDGYNGFCVCLYDNQGEILVSDMGETKEAFDEVTEEEWTKLCEDHGFEFRHWRIVKKFEDIYSVYDFIDFLSFIADTFDPIDE